MSKKSYVWNYFTKEKDKNGAKCFKCKKVIKCAGGSTSGLFAHLKSIHQITYSEINASGNENESVKRTKNSIEEEFGKLVSVDGFSYSPITSKSYKIQHSNHLTLVLEFLAGDESFMDVTLTAQGEAIKAHKSVLSAVSPYFHGVLKQNPCQHPIIIMPHHVKFDELSNIIGFIYKGEITVAAENLSSLLKTAEVLQVTGLSPSKGSSCSSDIMNQIKGIATRKFPSTFTGTTLSSKRTTEKNPKLTSETLQYATQESSQASASLEIFSDDMLYVKEEIESENDETVDSTHHLSRNTVEKEAKARGSSELSPNRTVTMDSPSRFLDDPTGKPFNPGEPASDDFPQDPLVSPPSLCPYVCPHCLETHRPQDVIHSHLRLKHPSKPSFVCPCGKVFVRQSIFVEHCRGCTF